jgi:predicted metal-dependent hydrolase
VSARDETILQGGRAKAYRPLPEPDRRAAIVDGLAAYEAGDWFLAHELLEPAWMGTRDLAERELLQGLIKLAAAFVHGARSNPAGVTKNLRGARERIVAGLAAGAVIGVDADALLGRIDGWLGAPGGAPIEIPRI